MKKRIRLQGMLMVLSVVSIIAVSKFLFPKWGKESFEELYDIVGTGLVIFGFLFRITARGYKKETSNQSDELVSFGPYSMVRNPMYFGTLLIGSGIIMVLFKWWVFFLFAVCFMLIYIPQVNREEKFLLEKFGEDYERCFRYAPRYFPLFKALLNIRSHLSLKLYWIKDELPSFVAVITI